MTAMLLDLGRTALDFSTLAVLAYAIVSTLPYPPSSK